MFKLKMQRLTRRWHRLLAIVVSLQLLAWTISGVFFAFLDITEVRGTPFKNDSRPPIHLPRTIDWVESPFEEMRVISRLGAPIIGTRQGNEWLWRDASGGPIAIMDNTEARSAAEYSTRFTATSARLIEAPSQGSEYRGHALPLYQIQVQESEDTRVYVDAYTGELRAIRSNTWRWWDFLWSLHIMDYAERDTIGTLLLKVFSVMSLLTSIAGTLLFFTSTKPRKKR
jgi:hypothetical protein